MYVQFFIRLAQKDLMEEICIVFLTKKYFVRDYDDCVDKNISRIEKYVNKIQGAVQ